MDADGAGLGDAGVPAARDPGFVARYLARDGLTLGAAPMPVPDGLGAMPAGAQLGVVLAGLDPGRVHRGQLADMIAAHNRMVAFEFAGLLEAIWEWARSPVVDGGTVVRREQAHRFAAKELAPLMAWTLYRSEQMLVLARLAVQVAPRLLEAVRAGRLDRDRLEVIAAELKTVTDEDVIASIVEAILDDVDIHTTGTLAERIRWVLGRLDPQAVRKSREDKLHARRLGRRDAPGGVSRLVLGCYDAAAAAAAVEHINAIAHATRTCGDPLARSLDQLRADIALDLLRGVDPARAGYVEPGQRQGTISLTVGLSTLAGLDDDCALLAGHGPVTADIARQTAAQFAHVCQWRFNLHDDDGTLLTEGHLSRSAVADLVTHLRFWAASDASRHPLDATAGPGGRAHRDPTAAQKAFVRARDKTCVFPGCRVPARHCDIDHRIAWVDGGTTTVANLSAVCRAHHRAKHMDGFDYQPGLGGTAWTTPGGQRYLKQHQPPPGHQHQHHARSHPRCQPVTVDLTGYTHTGGPPPRLRH